MCFGKIQGDSGKFGFGTTMRREGRKEGKEWTIELPGHVPSAKPQVCPGLCAWNAAAA